MSDRPDELSPGELLKKAVRSRIGSVQTALLGENPVRQASARGALAEWRRAVGKQPADAPVVWGSILGPNPVGQSEETLLDSRLLGTGDEASIWEWGAFTAITLYAAHQQSQTTGMHQVRDETAENGARSHSFSFGYAAGRLAVSSDSKSIKKRFDSIITAHSTETQLYHLRSYIQLLRSKAISLDYGLLATDLSKLRTPEYSKGVLLRWGRDFATAYNPPKSTTAK